MKKFYSLFLGVMFMLAANFAFAQISVTATSGTTGPTTYTTLKAAFDAINAGTHKGVVTVNVTGNTTETASAILNAPSATAAYTAVNVTTSGSFTISSAVAGPIIGLLGAANFTLNGNNTLVLNNTSTSGNVIGFANDANNNTIKNAILRGATNLVTSGLPTSGIIGFGAGTTNGNDFNTIDNCEIDGTGSAACGIFSSGSNASFNIQNSDNTIKNCRIHDCRSTSASIGIFFSQGNEFWTIDANSIYMTGSYSTPNQVIVRGMLLFPSYTGDAHFITNNYVGGSGPAAAGTMTLTSTNAVGFIGIDVETGGGNLIQGNTIKNVSLSYGLTGGSFSNSGIFGFIGNFNGFTLIQNNTISDISLTNSLGFISFSAIHVNGRIGSIDSTVRMGFTITSNTINNITGNSGNYPTGDVQMHGVRLETSSSGALGTTAVSNPLFTVTKNTIQNMAAPFSGGVTFIRGIGTTTLQGTTGGTSTAQLNPRVVIDSNSIHTFTTTSGLPSYGAGVLTGIHFGGSGGPTANATDVQRIRGNTIYDFNATNTDSATVVTGILATIGVHDISRNKIYDLRNSAVASTVTARPGIVGITMRNVQGTVSTYNNNMISLGNNVTSNMQIFGILQNFNATGTANVYYNSVVITGAGAVGNTRGTAALFRGTELFQTNTIGTPMNIKDNILINLRTGGGSHYAIANLYTTSPAAFTSDYNDLYTANAATLGLWGSTNTDFATWKTTSGQDANSKNVAVTFTNIATGDLHLSGASTTDANLNGTPIAGITIDYDNEARNATTPKMGADEPVPCVAPAITGQPSAQSTCAGNGPTTFSVTATGTALNYQWRKNGTAITGATGSSYTILIANTADAGNYDVIVSNGCGSVTSTAVAFTVNAPVTITTAPVGQTVCALNPVTFTVAATGAGTLTYQWKVGGTNIAGATSATYTIPSAAVGNTGQYTVTVTSSLCGSLTTNPVQLTVNACTAVPSLSADVTSAVLRPNIVRNQTKLRIVVKRSMKVDWVVTDATGNVVMRFTRQASAGTNDIQLPVQQLASGTYQVVGYSVSGRIATLRFVKQ